MTDRRGTLSPVVSARQTLKKGEMTMAIIKSIDPKMYPFRLKKSGRVKRIFWDRMSRPYYRRGNMRTYLDTVERLAYPYMYEDAEGKTGVISGWEYIGAYSPLYVEVLDDGENVQLWEEV